MISAKSSTELTVTGVHCRDDERGRDWDRGGREPRFDPYGPPRPGHFDDYDEHPRGGRPYDSYGPPRPGGGYDYPPPPPPRRPGYERETYERSYERYERPAERYERPAERYERPGGYGGRFSDFDDSLIPPPPPPRPGAVRDAPPPPPPAAAEEEEEDPERAAFEAELRNLQAEIGKVGPLVSHLAVHGRIGVLQGVGARFGSGHAPKKALHVFFYCLSIAEEGGGAAGHRGATAGTDGGGPAAGAGRRSRGGWPQAARGTSGGTQVLLLWSSSAPVSMIGALGWS